MKHGVKSNDEVAVQRTLDLRLLKKPEEKVSETNGILWKRIYRRYLRYDASVNPISDEDPRRLYLGLINPGNIEMLKLLVQNGRDMHRSFEYDKRYPIY